MRNAIFYKKFSCLPDTTEELVETGFLKGIPEEPMGGKFIIDKEKFAVDTSYINSLLKKCLEDLNSRGEKYYKKFGTYPEILDDLKNDPELGKYFPEHPYGGIYFIDHETHKVSSTRDFLAQINIEKP